MSEGPRSMREMKIAIGVSAHNEEQNIGALLERLVAVGLGDHLRIIVVASGCTDGTVSIVRKAARKDGRIELIVEPERHGKAAAINRLLEAARDADVIVGESADTLPEPGAIEKMVGHFADPTVGMVGSRPVPQDDSSTFVGYSTQLLWRLHHAVASRSPKQGELVAWRNVVRELPPDAIADEAYLEAEITRLGHRLVYEPDAIVHNRGPATLAQFVMQRRRNHSIHRTLAASTRYRPATRDHLLLARLGIAELAARPGRAHWLLAAAAVELWASMLGLWDHRVAKRDHTVWRMVEGTKGLGQTTLSDLPPVAVVVVSHDDRDGLLECLESVRRQRYGNYRVIVVNIGGTDGSVAALGAFPEIEVMSLAADECFARAFNSGCERALAMGSRYVLALQTDVVIAKDFLEQAVAVATIEPRAASVTGPVFYYDEPERVWYAGGGILWWIGKTYHIGRRVIWGPAFREPRRVAYAAAAAALYSCAALRAVGEFDERYFSIFDDSDWCVRASRRGWYHGYVPGPKAWRKVSSIAGEKSPAYLYFLFRNNIRFMTRNARPWHWPTFVAFFALESLLRYSLSSLMSPQRRIRELAIWLAMLDAVRARYGPGSSGIIRRALGARKGIAATDDVSRATSTG